MVSLMKNNKKVNPSYSHSNYQLMAVQKGNATLAMSLVLLAVVTVVGTTSSKTATNEVRMTSNSIEKQKSLIAADDAVAKAWEIVNTFTKMDFLDPCNRPGVYDLRTTAPATCSSVGENDQPVTTSFSNKRTSWDTSRNPVNWQWDATDHPGHHKSLDNKLSATTAEMLSSAEKVDPMKLYLPPQYSIAIHDPVYRAGSTQVCFPISIIGAAKGGVKETETFIEIRAIPANSCFPNI